MPILQAKCKLTAAVFLEVGELIAPLRDYTQRILEEGNNNQEPSDGWQVPDTERQSRLRKAQFL